MEQTGKKHSQNCVICLKIGDLYSYEYVNNLYKAIRKQTDEDVVCFTDDSTGIHPDIHTYDMQPRDCVGWKHLWCKIMMYGRKELVKYKKKIYFDLDLVIHGDIKPILEHDCDWALIRSKWKGIKFRIQYPHKAKFNSSVMVWKDNTWIYEKWEKDWRKIINKYDGNDDWYAKEYIIPTYLPNIFYSYREGSNPSHYWEGDRKPHCQYQPDYSVCLFHQKPDVHELDKDNKLYQIWNETIS